MLLGNLVENAVDECRKQPEEQRGIRLRAGQLVLFKILKEEASSAVVRRIKAAIGTPFV